MTPSGAGLVFGKYEIQHRIAIGGMGEVFYAVQRGVPGFERPVILKSLLPDLAQQKDFIDQFLDEARVAATLNHPNVVSIFEVGLWNGTYFIAMEYIRGRNLAQLLRRCVEQQVQIPVMVTARIIADAALGLDHAHGASTSAGEPLHIVHRDISPQNIMVRDDGVTKVVDFGIARASNRSTRTATGTVKGKLAYMAPEQVHGGAGVTSAVDQYALGVCFWELLTQRRLFKADSDIELLKLVLAGEVRAPSTLREGVDEELDRIVLRMMSPRAEDRFASCAEVAAQLNDYLAARSPPGGVQPGAFLKRLGTSDLAIRPPSPSNPQNNFVISLEMPNPAHALPPPPSEPVELIATRDVQLVLPPKRTGRMASAIVVALVVVSALVGYGLNSRAQKNPVVEAQSDAGMPVVVAEPVDAGNAPSVPQVPSMAKLSIASTPSGATVRVDGKPSGTTPLVIEVSPNAVHYLQLEKVGYRRTELESTPVEPESTLELSVNLVKVETRAPANLPSTTPSEPPRSAEPGFLSLDTNPWTKVRIDGDSYGSTPLFKVKLAPGTHSLAFTNEGASIQSTRTVEIQPGKTVKLSLKLGP